MNKIFIIISAVVLSGCANTIAFKNYSGGTLGDLLKARHQCASELGGSMSCGAFRNCLALKGWVRTDNANDIVVPDTYTITCGRN